LQRSHSQHSSARMKENDELLRQMKQKKETNC